MYLPVPGIVPTSSVSPPPPLQLTRWSHVLAGPNGLEAHEGHLHREHQAQDKEGGVGHVDAGGVAAHQQQHKHMQRDQVDDEHVASPRRYLVDKPRTTVSVYWA